MRFHGRQHWAHWKTDPGIKVHGVIAPSDGMGLLEFLVWTEDMGAEPLLAVYAGYSLNGDHVDAGPLIKALC